MKTLILFLSFIGLFLFSASGQYYPGGINYQAIARDNSGNELKNRNIEVRVSVISGTPAGDIEYSETHDATTDGFGLFNFVIGQGSRFAGKKTTLAEVNWGSAPHFLKVEVDFTGNGIFLDMTPMPLQAVPYALHAGTAANAMVTTDYQELTYDPATKKLSLENGGMADLSNLSQNLSYQANGTLSISNGNSVVIDNRDGDYDPFNEIQDLQLRNDTLFITRNTTANQIPLTRYHQKLEITDGKLVLTHGNSVKVDLSDTNEIQDLNLADDILTISMNPSAPPVDLSKYNQQLSLNGTDLSLENGGTVNIRPDVIAFRALRNGGNLLQAGDSIELKFINSVPLNTNNVFDPGTGRFTVPQNGEGLYNFDITYYYYDSHHSLRFAVNGIIKEIVFDFAEITKSGFLSYNIITFLNPGDKVSIYLKNTRTISTINCQPAIFSGYRIH